MHEFGLCEGVLEAVLKRAAGRRVAGIRVRCGERHVVDPPSMAQAFSMIAAGTEAADAVVEVITVPGEELTLEWIRYASEDGAEVTRRFALREEATRHLAGQAGAVAAACHAMAVRFQQGGKLVTFGTGGASADAQHVAVEFVHPVLVGKRALPAIALTTDVATVTGIAERDGVDAIFAHQIRYVADPADIALGIGNSPSVIAGLKTAAELGLLTVALVGGDPIAADHVLVAASDDPRIVKEVHVTTYHILWELVHVFFEQPAVIS
ncbi:MAG: SIS domain-containing protein [Streptosporangiaceae bacterium]|jgi:D-sedoheptulose 7-phosphate isomerase